MDSVLKDMKRRFPQKAHRLRVGLTGKSIQIMSSKLSKPSGKSPTYMTVCIPHCRDKYSCVQCSLSSAAAKENALAVAKGQLERLRARFPDYDLAVSMRRIDGLYRVVRRYDSSKKYYRVCLKHGRLFKQCAGCRYVQDEELDPIPPAPISSTQIKMLPDPSGASSNSNGGGGGGDSSGDAPAAGEKRKRVVPAYSATKNKSATKTRVKTRRINMQKQKTQGLLRNMTGRFPQHTLRISKTGKEIQRKCGSSWLTVCTLHCKERRTCKACGFGAANNAKKRQKMLPVLKDMRRRFPDYTLEISQRQINGEFPIVRLYPNSKYPKKAYAVCIPHGKLLKQCRSGCVDMQAAKKISIKA